MNYKFSILLILIIISSGYSSFAQNNTSKEYHISNVRYTYAYIFIIGRPFKKLKVEVDLGDTPEQIKLASDYADILSSKLSYSAILNYMSENDYEFIESRSDMFSFQGTGGSNGIIFIMRKRVR